MTDVGSERLPDWQRLPDRLNRKRRAAATGSDGIGIIDREPRALKPFGVVHF